MSNGKNMKGKVRYGRVYLVYRNDNKGKALFHNGTVSTDKDGDGHWFLGNSFETYGQMQELFTRTGHKPLYNISDIIREATIQEIARLKLAGRI